MGPFGVAIHLPRHLFLTENPANVTGQFFVSRRSDSPLVSSREAIGPWIVSNLRTCPNCGGPLPDDSLHSLGLGALSGAERERTVLELLNQMQIQRAEDFFVAGDAARAVAYLARVLTRDRSNRVAAERLVSTLT